MILYLIRHGQVDNPSGLIYGRVHDLSLSPLGFREAERLAVEIKEQGDTVQIIYASPLKRTRQMVDQLHQVFGKVPTFFDDRLLETDSTNYVDRPISWAHSLGDVYSLKDKDFTIETPESMAGRITSVITEARNLYPEKTIAIVSHGDPLAFALNALLYPGQPLLTIVELRGELFLKMGQAWRLEMDAGGKVQTRERIETI